MTGIAFLKILNPFFVLVLISKSFASCLIKAIFLEWIQVLQSSYFPPINSIPPSDQFLFSTYFQHQLIQCNPFYSKYHNHFHILSYCFISLNASCHLISPLLSICLPCLLRKSAYQHIHWLSLNGCKY